MKNMRGTVMRMGGAGLLAATLALSLNGCAGSSATTEQISREATSEQVGAAAGEQDSASTSSDGTAASTASMSTSGALATSDIFTERDLEQTADLTGATTCTVTSGQDIQITEEGVYVITGDATEATIIVDAEDTAKVQLVLDGVSISNADFPAIYVKSADKVFVTTAEGSTNVLEVTGTFTADGDTNTDAVIFSKDDLVLNGLGTLKVTSTGNGITCKDDLKVTGGSYDVQATADGLEANDSIAICDGTLAVTSGKDGLHAENDEDDTVGYLYVCGGSLTVDAADDALQATTVLQIDDGTFALNAAECLEATYVQVNGGDLSISASDDGINATTKSASMGTPTIEVTGGSMVITMGAGDTDALDANGNIVVSGGTIDITGQFAFDFDGTASFTGGTITVNGEEISEISNSMMGGGMPGGGGFGPMDGGQQEGMGPQGGHGPQDGRGTSDGAFMM